MLKLEEIKYEFNNKIIYREKEELVIAFNEDTGDMYEFNSIGGEIFKDLYLNIEIKDILNKLLREYDVKIQDIYEDVSLIIERIIELKIIYVK